MMFKYTSNKNLSMILNRLQQFGVIFSNARFSPGCRLPSGLFYFNVAIIPCNLTTGTPRPICSRSCSNYFSSCNGEFNAFLDFTRSFNFPLSFMQNCENTLHHINMGYGYPNSSNDFEDDCIDIPGSYAVLNL